MHDGDGMSNGYPINWSVNAGNTAILQHPLYITYSNLNFNQVNDKRAQIIGDIKAARAGLESAEIIAYLVWLLRTTALFA